MPSEVKQKQFIEALVEALQANQPTVESVTRGMVSNIETASGILPALSRNLRDKGAFQWSLMCAAIFGIIRCFGVAGAISIVLKLRKEVT
jgi:hypothetical protein